MIQCLEYQTAFSYKKPKNTRCNNEGFIYILSKMTKRLKIDTFSEIMYSILTDTTLPFEIHFLILKNVSLLCFF